MEAREREFSLLKRGGRVIIRFADGHDEVPVRLAWARPVSGRGQEVAVLDAKTKKEILFLTSLDALDEESRRVAERELAERYFLPRIQRVVATEWHFGNLYWQIETDRGPKRFLMKSPETNATWVSEDRCVLRDTLGNCFEIPSLAGLDAKSRAEVEKVL